MPEKITKAQRWLDLVVFLLRHRFPVSVGQIMEAVRSQFDWVLVDTPPIIGLADAAVVCPMVDGVVLVVAGESTRKPQVERAIEQVQSVGGKILGVVLNKVNLQSDPYYYSQHYGEYYRSYYAEGKGYGETATAQRRRPRPVARPSRPARRA